MVLWIDKPVHTAILFSYQVQNKSVFCIKNKVNLAEIAHALLRLE